MINFIRWHNLNNERMGDCYDLKMNTLACHAKPAVLPLTPRLEKIVAAYHPLLKALDLTYAQYVTLMVLWEEKEISMHQLEKRLYLDSGTLTPVLKAEAAGYIRRYRDPQDERNLIAALTDQGLALRDKAKTIPHAMTCKLNQKGTSLFPGRKWPNWKKNSMP